jgi:hypothetical protein
MHDGVSADSAAVHQGGTIVRWQMFRTALVKGEIRRSYDTAWQYPE